MNNTLKPFFHFYIYNAILAIVFGILLLVIPQISLMIFLFLLASFLIVDGIFHIINIIRFPHTTPQKWLRIFRSSIGIAAGIAILVIPDISAVMLLYFLAGWFIYVGIFEILITGSYKEILTNRRYILLFSCISIVFGFCLLLWLLIHPESATVALAWFLGLGAILWGLGYIIYPLRISRLFKNNELL